MSIIDSLGIVSPGGSGDISTGLIAHYKMNDNAASTTITAAVGTNATYTDGGGPINTSTGSVAGKINTAIDFDGGDEFATAGVVANLDFVTTDTFTVNVWVNIGTAIETGYLITKYNNTTGWGVYFDGANDTIDFFHDAGGQESSNAIFTESGSWVMVTVVYVNGSASFYKNSAFANTVSGIVITSNVHSFLIGNRTDGAVAATFLDGSLDDIRVYNRALNSADINALYNGGSGTEA